MQLNIHLNFNGNCDEAFAFYEHALGLGRLTKMTYADAPQGSPVPPDWSHKIMHTSINLGTGLLMGCDASPAHSTPIGGFQVSLELPHTSPTAAAEVNRIFDALIDGGKVKMPITPTFWSPLFGMCTDKFGVDWMISLSQQAPAQPMPAHPMPA